MYRNRKDKEALNKRLKKLSYVLNKVTAVKDTISAFFSNNRPYKDLDAVQAFLGMLMNPN